MPRRSRGSRRDEVKLRRLAAGVHGVCVCLCVIFLPKIEGPYVERRLPACHQQSTITASPLAGSGSLLSNSQVVVVDALVLTTIRSPTSTNSGI